MGGTTIFGNIGSQQEGFKLFIKEPLALGFQPRKELWVNFGPKWEEEGSKRIGLTGRIFLKTFPFWKGPSKIGSQVEGLISEKSYWCIVGNWLEANFHQEFLGGG